MNQALAGAIAAFTLNPTYAGSQQLANFSRRDWKRTYHWLDTSGLALALCSSLEATGGSEQIPEAVRARLQQNLRDNTERCTVMFEELLRIHRAFRGLGRVYAVHKGFSLVPDFCPDPRYRVQHDNDFRVQPGDAALFQDALERLGYGVFYAEEGELSLDTRPGFVAQLSDTYRPPPSFRSELHSEQAIGGECIHLSLPAGYLDRVKPRMICGQWIPALDDVDRFLDQVGHFLRHLEKGWVRLSWALELAAFCRFKFDDRGFWAELAEYASADRVSAVSVSFALTLLEHVLQAPMPPELDWRRSVLPARISDWIERHGSEALFAEFPGSKLPLLILREFPGVRPAASMERKRLLPIKVPPRISMPVDSSLAARIAAYRAQLKFVRVRAKFHFKEGIRYWRARRQWQTLLWRREHAEAAAVSEGGS